MLHTANPITGATGELFGEAVVGMGEALVGNQPGRALSFSARQAGGQGEPQVHILQDIGIWKLCKHQMRMSCEIYRFLFDSFASEGGRNAVPESCGQFQAYDACN